MFGKLRSAASRKKMILRNNTQENDLELRYQLWQTEVHVMMSEVHVSLSEAKHYLRPWKLGALFFFFFQFCNWVPSQQ